MLVSVWFTRRDAKGGINTGSATTSFSSCVYHTCDCSTDEWLWLTPGLLRQRDGRCMVADSSSSSEKHWPSMHENLGVNLHTLEPGSATSKQRYLYIYLLPTVSRSSEIPLCVKPLVQWFLYLHGCLIRFRVFDPWQVLCSNCNL